MFGCENLLGSFGDKEIVIGKWIQLMDGWIDNNKKKKEKKKSPRSIPLDSKY